MGGEEGHARSRRQACRSGSWPRRGICVAAGVPRPAPIKPSPTRSQIAGFGMQSARSACGCLHYSESSGATVLMGDPWHPDPAI
jgi:hypothetical protein